VDFVGAEKFSYIKIILHYREQISSNIALHLFISNIDLLSLRGDVIMLISKQ